MKYDKIPQIKKGTAIDHLNKGTALKAIEVLGLEDIGVVTIGMNLYSKKLGSKDVIKIENKELTQDEINKIALIAPYATISIIKNYNVVKKFKVRLPKIVEGIIKCINEKCMTNNEKVISKFHILDVNPLKLRCHYCERTIKRQDIEIL